jgi:hypothetical protein
MTTLPCHDGDGATRATSLRWDVNVESCCRRCCRVILAMALSGRLRHDAMWMPSHADDNAIESCS